MHQFGWLSERRGEFFNLLQKEGVPRKGMGELPQKRGDSNSEGNCVCLCVCGYKYVYMYTCVYVYIYTHFGKSVTLVAPLTFGPLKVFDLSSWVILPVPMVKLKDSSFQF